MRLHAQTSLYPDQMPSISTADQSIKLLAHYTYSYVYYFNLDVDTVRPDLGFRFLFLPISDLHFRYQECSPTFV